MAEREQNLTWSTELGDDNRIVAGRWWTAADRGQPLVSLATEFQESLGLKLGDRLEFDVAGEPRRRPRGELPQGALGQLPAEFLHRVRARAARFRRRHVHDQRPYEPHGPGALAGLVRHFPSVSIFDIGDLLAQVRAVMDKAVHRRAERVRRSRCSPA